MSDEQRRDEETEVEGHRTRVGTNDEPAEEGENDVEAHRHLNVRLDSTSNA